MKLRVNREISHQVMSLSGLYEVDVGARMHIHYVTSGVGRQQQPIIAALVGQPG